MPVLLGSIGMLEMVALAIVAVILFGERLPEVARQVGGVYRELRKHIQNVQTEFMSAADEASRDRKKPSRPARSQAAAAEDRDEPTAPRFEPPPAAPTEEKG